jgi:hypothetical protein
MLTKIEVQKEFDEKELFERLRNVKLKGFPNVKIYANSALRVEQATSERIMGEIFTPQPRVYRDYLDRINKMAELFQEKGIDIFRLNGGVDYTAFDEKDEATNWTIIPPVVEVLSIFFGRGLDYQPAIGSDLEKSMAQSGSKLNPELEELSFKEYPKVLGYHQVPIICDGSHRVHSQVEQGKSQNLLFVYSPELGYPYYAAPKPYSLVHVEPTRIDGSKSDKVHVLTEPGHKLLYRLFPTGGILSGEVRPDVVKK